MGGRYQEGSLEREKRKSGPDAWYYRWVENGVQKKKVIGYTDRLKTVKDAKREVENFRAQLNSVTGIVGKMTVFEAWGHFLQHELYSETMNRSPTTIQGYLDYFKNQILPKWRDVALEDVKATAVEAWLASLTTLAPGTKAKLRNHLSALFSHCIRHELYHRLNPIHSVRQSAVRRRTPDILTFEEMAATIDGIDPQVIRVMMTTAAASALRRSEVRGLRWDDLDFNHLWFHPRRGLVRKSETSMKGEASRQAVPMAPELAVLLLEWRSVTPYPAGTDWVFASPYTEGKRPYWPDSALVDHIRPSAVRAGIDKVIGWHTLRHSFASLMGRGGEDVKTVQELLRHASSKITLDIYQQGYDQEKRDALDNNLSPLFNGKGTGKKKTLIEFPKANKA